MCSGWKVSPCVDLSWQRWWWEPSVLWVSLSRLIWGSVMKASLAPSCGGCRSSCVLAQKKTSPLFDVPENTVDVTKQEAKLTFLLAIRCNSSIKFPVWRTCFHEKLAPVSQASTQHLWDFLGLLCFSLPSHCGCWYSAAAVHPKPGQFCCAQMFSEQSGSECGPQMSDHLTWATRLESNFIGVALFTVKAIFFCAGVLFELCPELHVYWFVSPTKSLK